MKILVTNDDSLSYEGIKVLAEYAKIYADSVMVVAPHVEKSACSHGLTLKKPIKLYQEPDLIEGVKTYSIDGTPSDCVKVAKYILNFDFDIVFSGINNGFNLADDICYSGTASAALDAEFYDKKGIAFSMQYGDLSGSKYIKETLDYLFKQDIYKKYNVFNINFPSNPIGIKITKQGKRAFNGTFLKLDDSLYQAVTADKENTYIIREENQDDDFKAIEDGYISISLITNNLNVIK